MPRIPLLICMLAGCLSGAGSFEEIQSRISSFTLKNGMTFIVMETEWRDLLLFHEYFHGDTGAGIGASHQTGWTGIVADLICRGGVLDTRRSIPVPD